MYEHFNPFANPEAWWQHLVMLVGAAILGYIIGYIGRKSELVALEEELASLETGLEDCLNSKKVSNRTLIAQETPAVTPVPVVETPIVPPTPDDLKIVEGIGPKIEQLFNSKGIYTFAQLAAANPAVLKGYLDGAGPNYRIHDPSTWPQQAALARDGKFEELQKWQDELKGGKTE
ncbi:MAG: hypothetical protein U0Y10_21325 [Spirosomataceae bacterium]